MNKLIGKLSERKGQHRVLSNDYPYFYLSMLWMVLGINCLWRSGGGFGGIDRVTVAMLDSAPCNSLDPAGWWIKGLDRLVSN
jgi:hypothetical protein